MSAASSNTTFLSFSLNMTRRNKKKTEVEPGFRTKTRYYYKTFDSENEDLGKFCYERKRVYNYEKKAFIYISNLNTKEMK